MEEWDNRTKSTLTKIPLLTTKAGPRDGAAWTARLKGEYKALIASTSMNKSNDNDWFRISAANPEGTRWTGKCWYIHNLLKYELDLEFDIPMKLMFAKKIREIICKICRVRIRGGPRWDFRITTPHCANGVFE